MENSSRFIWGKLGKGKKVVVSEGGSKMKKFIKRNFKKLYIAL